MKIPVHKHSFILAAIDAKKLNSNSLPRNDIYINVEDTLGKYAPQYANFILVMITSQYLPSFKPCVLNMCFEQQHVDHMWSQSRIQHVFERPHVDPI